MIFKLAWRSIWRNKRRTLITMASVFFAVLLAVLMRSANSGIYAHMVHNVVSFSSGYIQIHKAGYWEEQSVDNGFVPDSSLIYSLRGHRDILDYVPRLESFALASAGERTKGVLVLGIDPRKENKITQLEEKMISGEYLSSADRSVILAEDLARNLKVTTGDTVVLLSQGYHGASAAGKYPVKGIVRFGSPELNKRMVYLPLPLMQEMFGADQLITSISVMLKEGDKMAPVKNRLLAAVDTSSYEVMDWKQMLPELDQLIEGDKSGDYIIIGILYLVIAFGVFGTILMMTKERMHEFGILISIGMKKRILSSAVMLESFIMTFLATLAGMAAALPVILWFKYHPIRLSGKLQEVYARYGLEAVIPLSDQRHVFIEQASIVFILALLLSVYAAWRVYSLKPIEALRS